MIISFFGKQSFKFQHGDTVLGVNPIGKTKDSDLKPTRYGADIFLSTTSLPEYRGAEDGDKETFYIKGAGEYEVKNIFIKGFETPCEIDGKKYINTAYNFSLDNIDVVFLGCVTSSDIPSATREGLGSPQIVFVPIGDILSAEKAYKLAMSFEPSIVVPVEYTKESLKQFLKIDGREKAETLDKLTIKRKELDTKEVRIIVFEN